MKLVKIFSLGEETEINKYLEEVKDKMIGATLNILPEKIVVVIESDKRTADRIASFEQQRTTSQGQKDNATLSIAAIDKELAELNDTIAEVGSEASTTLANKISDLKTKKLDYEAVISTQDFYLSQIDEFLKTLTD